MIFRGKSMKFLFYLIGDVTSKMLKMAKRALEK